MDKLKNRFQEKTTNVGEEIKALLAEHGNFVVGETKLSQLYGGMRGMLSLVTETSLLDANDGIRFRGYSIPELKEQLPKAEGGSEPLPEGLFYLMLVGTIPTEDEVAEITASWRQRSDVPQHVFDVLESFPKETHPMTMFSAGVLALQETSTFAQAYKKGINKKDYWDYTYEDTMNLIAKLPRIAAYIYRRKYKNDDHIEPDTNLDWGANFAHMLGYNNKGFRALMRLYLTIHADHEGGNASAHTTHLVGSTLSDAYLALSGGLNALAGPLHGLANQEVIRWIEQMRKELDSELPNKQQIVDYIQKTLDEGRVVPGYGHAVLRQTDPRYTAQLEFGKEHCPDDPLVQTVWNIYDVAPDILKATGKIKNPWPNVDAHSGSLLKHYGVVEEEFYTVLFGVSRAMGVLASLCWDRVLGMPIERPKSITLKGLKEMVANETVA